jgi:hypothetical protein
MGYKEIRYEDVDWCRSRWPRGLRHELSSLARTPGSCVRIPHKGMNVCVYVYTMFVLSFFCGFGLTSPLGPLGSGSLGLFVQVP